MANKPTPIGSYILNLPILTQGKAMTEAEIVQASNLKASDKDKAKAVNRDLFTLVCTGKLEKILGIASCPATYCLPNYAAELTRGTIHNVL